MNSSNRGMIIGLIVGVVALVAVAGLFTSYNYAVRSENAIVANRDSARNVLGQYTPMLREAVGVTRLQANDLRELFEASNESRYGADGSSAAIQFIREQNPNLDQSNYGRIINLIEAGRRDFRTAQDQQIDRVRDYKTGSQTFPRVMFLSIVGKPTDGFFEEYGKIVTSSHAEEAYKTGIDDGIAISNIQ